MQAVPYRLNSLKRIFLNGFFIAFITYVLTGCAAHHLYGYEDTFKTYSVPKELIAKIKDEFKQFDLPMAEIKLDQTGRVQLIGNFNNEDEVDKAFLIIQSNIGVKSTSPFYPRNIKKRRVSIAMHDALHDYAVNKKWLKGDLVETENIPEKEGVKRALIIGINQFKYPSVLTDINGADDAKVVAEKAEKAGFIVTKLINEKATRNNIKKAIKEISKSIQKEDTLLLYVSSHGLQPIPTPVKDSRRMSILAYDSGQPGIEKIKDTRRMIILQKTSIPDYLLQNLVRKDIRKKRVLIDTCYSGNMFDLSKNELSKAYIRKTNNGKSESFGVTISSWVDKGIQGNIVSQSSTNRGEDWKKNANKNFIVITATSPNEKSFGPKENRAGIAEFKLDDGTRLVGSFFTQSFLAYLEKYNNQLEPAFRYASEFTQKKVDEITKMEYSQHPQMFPHLNENDPIKIY